MRCKTMNKDGEHSSLLTDPWHTVDCDTWHKLTLGYPIDWHYNKQQRTSSAYSDWRLSNKKFSVN
jgi:hypothetical protein